MDDKEFTEKWIEWYRMSGLPENTPYMPKIHELFERWLEDSEKEGQITMF